MKLKEETVEEFLKRTGKKVTEVPASDKNTPKKKFNNGYESEVTKKKESDITDDTMRQGEKGIRRGYRKGNDEDEAVTLYKESEINMGVKMKESIENMLNLVAQKDLSGAEEQFNYIFSQKIADRLETMKQEIGHAMMNPKKEEE